MVSVEVGISVALIELFAGVIVGMPCNVDVPSWLSFGRFVRRDPAPAVPGRRWRRTCRSSGASGGRRARSASVSFGASVCRGRPALPTTVLDWTRRQAEIGGLALSTTSLAVVYAVLVETGLRGVNWWASG